MGIYEPYVKAESTKNSDWFAPRLKQSDAIDRAFKYFKINECKESEFLLDKFNLRFIRHVNIQVALN